MKISNEASERLRTMLHRAGKKYRGFRFEGSVGSCRGSLPLLKPAIEKKNGEITMTAGGITFFLPEELAEVFLAADLDYDSSPLFGRGLTMKWPHGTRGCPGCGNH